MYNTIHTDDMYFSVYFIVNAQYYALPGTSIIAGGGMVGFTIFLLIRL